MKDKTRMQREERRWNTRQEKIKEERREEKRREKRRREKKQDKRRDKMKRERWRKDEFFLKNVSGHSNPPDELA